MAQKAKKKKWYTIAWLTREGNPHPAFQYQNFTQVFKTEKMLVDDLSYGMISWSHGSYAAVAWPGQVDKQTALHTNLKPVLQVFEGGIVQKIP